MNMNKASLSRIVTGLVILAIGVGALLGVVGLYDFGDVWSKWWPVLVIAGGLLILINDVKQYIWAAIAMLAGVLFLLERHDVIDFNIWQLIWPVAIIGVGLSILINRSGNKTRSTDKDTTTLNVLLSGSEIKNHSQDYKGGNISATLGGISLDLREANIKKTATLSVFSLMGGIELKVPKDWIIQTNITPVLGGVEGGRIETPKSGGPTLILTGDVIMGGVEIKH